MTHETPAAGNSALSPADSGKARAERLRICRECAFRDVQTCRRNERPCYDNATTAFCPAAMFGDLSGSWPSGYHNEPLYRDTLAAPPPAPDPFVGEPVVHLGCHLWPVIYADEPCRPWFDQIDLWEELADQLNGHAVVYVATGPNTATFAAVQRMFSNRFELREIPNDENEGENPSFRALLETFPSGPDDVMIYCHAKGVQAARRGSEAVQLWRELLYETVAFNWRRALDKLEDGYKAFGSFRAFTTSTNVIPFGWYYSGTFFVARLKWLRSAGGTPLPVSPIWGGVEHFLGTHFPARECWCEFADGRDLSQEYSMLRMFPDIVHDGFRWEMEGLRDRFGVHCEQHGRELNWLLEKIEPGDRVLVIGSRAGGIESILKHRFAGLTTISIDPDPLPENPHAVIIGSSHDAEVQFQARALGGFDVVFIDGDHTLEGVRADWEFAQKLQPRIVAFHDIASTTFHRSLECNVAPLWAEIKATHDTDEKIVGGGWGGIGVVYLETKLDQLAEDRAAAHVSIIITVGPGYEKFAAAAIESAARQGTIGASCELIVVWDGSEDPGGIPLPPHTSYESIFVDFRNVQKARRAGLERSRGRYTLFLDADDQLPDFFVEVAISQLRAAEERDPRVAGIYPSAEYTDVITGEARERVVARAWDRTLFDAANFMVISTLTRTEDLRLAAWGGSDMRTLEDHQMWKSLVDRGVRFIPGVDLWLSVGVHENSLSRTVVHTEYSELHAIAAQPITAVLLLRDLRRGKIALDWLWTMPPNVRTVVCDLTGCVRLEWDEEAEPARHPDVRVVHCVGLSAEEITNRAIQETVTPLILFLDDEILPQMKAGEALAELAAGFEDDIGAVCGLTGSRTVDTSRRFATVNGSGFGCVLARTRALQEAGPLYASTAVEPWPDVRFWASFYFGRYRVRVANRVPCAHVDRRLEILTYHEVDPANPSTWSITPDLFRAHLTWLRENGWKFRTVDGALLQYGPAEKTVVITFDDGRLGCWDHARPILEEFGISATFYICAEMTDGHAADHQKYTEFMTWDNVLALEQAGHEIGNHALRHIPLADETPAAVLHSVETSNLVIETLIKEPCLNFAPPYGSTSPTVADIVRNAGYSTLAGTEDRGNPLPLDRFNLGRRQITNGTTVEQLAAMLGGGN
jgi:peptidoglycan/xylan/chitin deacetylase (PgdA/CDA1 family)